MISADGSLAENLGDRSRDYRRTRLAADEDHLIDVRGLQLCVPQGFLTRLDRGFDEVSDQFFEFFAGQNVVLMCFGPVGSAAMNGRLIVVSFDARQLAFCTLGGLL